MALDQPPGSSPAKDKLIFAPAGNKSTGQADQFTLSTLSLADLDRTSPIRQFHAWFSHAQSSQSIPHPEACSLSTAELPSGRVSSRMVYLKELEDSKSDSSSSPGFVIYTNTGHSRKAKDIASNPYASLLFFWEPLQRQVRVEGPVEKLTREESQTYFDTRVRGSRIGAWASRQSHVLEPQGGEGKDDGREQLVGWVKEVEEKFEGQDKIPVPEFWGGLRIVPERVEFWQGRDSRLHDRFVYEKEADGWKLSRLSP
ncbi:pyridoxamine 5'-phosphate oxidase domain-containing protein [Sarocladium implicatum]|nr:pyridoxamine 5'-phosphate oxidase domain-containing protein [Sarocladium implicatum]